MMRNVFDQSGPGKLWAPLASKMCDRTAQLAGFMEFFHAHRPRPQVYVLHGDQSEAHDSFLQRVRGHLKNYLEDQGLIGISSHVVPWVRPGALADQKQELPRNLFTLFEQWSASDASATALSQLPCLKRYSVVILSHNLDLAAWHDRHSPSLLCWYIRNYWGQLAVTDHTPQFLIFLKLQYAPAPGSRWLPKFLRKDPRESIIAPAVGPPAHRRRQVSIQGYRGTYPHPGQRRPGLVRKLYSTSQIEETVRIYVPDFPPGRCLPTYGSGGRFS